MVSKRYVIITLKNVYIPILAGSSKRTKQNTFIGRRMNDALLYSVGISQMFAILELLV